MKAAKLKIVRAKSATKKGGLYSVNIARMEQYFAENRPTFSERARIARTSTGEFVGVLAGPTARSRTK